MAGKMPTGLTHNRPGWSSRNRDHIEAKDADGAIRVARRYYSHSDPSWYPVHAADTDFGYTSSQVREAIEARGNRLFRVHFHRLGYKHLNCPFEPKVAVNG